MTQSNQITKQSEINDLLKLGARFQVVNMKPSTHVPGGGEVKFAFESGEKTTITVANDTQYQECAVLFEQNDWLNPDQFPRDLAGYQN